MFAADTSQNRSVDPNGRVLLTSLAAENIFAAHFVGHHTGKLDDGTGPMTIDFYAPTVGPQRAA